MHDLIISHQINKPSTCNPSYSCQKKKT